MKKLVFVLLMGIILVPKAFSFTTIKYPDVFYSFFDDPDTIINFINLKDGTCIDDISDGDISKTSLISNLDNCMLHTGSKSSDGSTIPLAVSSQAFSDEWSFRGAHPTTPGLFCEAIIWFNQGITTGEYHMAVSATAGLSKPFVMYTNKGFIGIIPNSSEETDFIFDSFNTVFSFETGFTVAAPKPEPEPSLPLDQHRIIFSEIRPKKLKR